MRIINQGVLNLVVWIEDHNPFPLLLIKIPKVCSTVHWATKVQKLRRSKHPILNQCGLLKRRRRRRSSLFYFMCWGCQVVPIHIAVDDIDSPFIWNSARHSAIDFSIVGKIWNVPFYIITSQLLTCCCSHGMQVFLPPLHTQANIHAGLCPRSQTWTHTYTAARNDTTRAARQVFQYHLLDQTAHKWTLVLISAATLFLLYLSFLS